MIYHVYRDLRNSYKTPVKNAIGQGPFNLIRDH